MGQSKLQNSLAVVGDQDRIEGLRALGFKIYPIGKTPLKEIFDEVVKNQTAICLIQESIFLKAQADLQIYRNLALPIFLPFPEGENMHTLDEAVKNIKLRATGKN